ncbi:MULTISPECIES: substrate-binding domain-containing protein [unclassified Micromonospora]|uniref:substrate-binding domain-containing protein n=1 Tax=unclassified Micromonospora TaxID=2617518 RepID=UPI00259C72EB|nr:MULTISPECIES: substrate-binding domain-containing protein [unclassified Micromonospora]MDM4781392.1 substrate-binding domain-containing protein [Micromonospora sp. b486]
MAGIDDIEEGRFSNPTLTSIAPDKRETGRLAVRRLVARIEGEGGPPMHAQPAFHLVERESTRPAR